MSIATAQPKTGLVPYRLKVRQFEQMIDAGILPAERRIELLDGMLVDKMTKNDPHDFGVSQLSEDLRRLLPRDWTVREEKSVRLSMWSRPEPDVAVVRGPLQRYRSRTPRPADTPLIVEVCDTTYYKDRHQKWPLYASAGIAVYWILNIPDRRVEVFTEPAGRGESAGYAREECYDDKSEVPVVILGTEIGRIAVQDLLP